MAEGQVLRFTTQADYHRNRHTLRSHWLFASALLLLAVTLPAGPDIAALSGVLLAVAILRGLVRRLKSAERWIVKTLADELGPVPDSPDKKHHADG
ncbi:hypothetical protein AB0N89_12115 [Amycolatopsis sp. NPDC089917]|uniref:hypothetical protein n=1 Tax=Amycolatopsis sp. NPDC089917 TaxID=3155187 RepID=UPI0034330CE2